MTNLKIWGRNSWIEGLDFSVLEGIEELVEASDVSWLSTLHSFACSTHESFKISFCSRLPFRVFTLESHFSFHSLSTWFTHSLISSLFRLDTAPAHPTCGGNLDSPPLIGGYFVAIHWTIWWYYVLLLNFSIFHLFIYMSFSSFVNLFRFLDMIWGSLELYVSLYDDFNDCMFGYLERDL